MDMKKAFVSLGIGVLVVTGLIQSGVIDVNQVFTTGDSAPGINLANKTLDEKWGGSAAQGQSTSPAVSNTLNQATTSQPAHQPTYNESEWGKVKEKTCEVAWNNADFKDGWCKLYRFSPGEYRFKIQSSLELVSNDGSKMTLPPEGAPIKRWRDMKADAFADHFETWSSVKNGMVGMVIFKVDSEYPLTTWTITLSQPQIIYASINFPPTEDNWKKMGFNGKVTIEILKKKT